MEDTLLYEYSYEKPELTNEFLEHYGILGMKWGVRRGPYPIGSKKGKVKKSKAKAKKVYKTREQIIKDRDIQEMNKRKDEFTTQEINDVLNRIGTETRLSQLAKQTSKKEQRKKKIKDIINNKYVRGATLLALGAATTYILYKKKVKIDPNFKALSIDQIITKADQYRNKPLKMATDIIKVFNESRLKKATDAVKYLPSNHYYLGRGALKILHGSFDDKPSLDELYHHGILGMQWGKRNGPPYPLDSKISTGKRFKNTGSIIKKRIDKKNVESHNKEVKNFEKRLKKDPNSTSQKIIDDIVNNDEYKRAYNNYKKASNLYKKEFEEKKKDPKNIQRAEADYKEAYKTDKVDKNSTFYKLSLEGYASGEYLDQPINDKKVVKKANELFKKDHGHDYDEKLDGYIFDHYVDAAADELNWKSKRIKSNAEKEFDKAIDSYLKIQDKVITDYLGERANDLIRGIKYKYRIESMIENDNDIKRRMLIRA